MQVYLAGDINLGFRQSVFSEVYHEPVSGRGSDALQGAHCRLGVAVLKPRDIALVSMQPLCELILDYLDAHAWLQEGRRYGSARRRYIMRLAMIQIITTPPSNTPIIASVPSTIAPSARHAENRCASPTHF